MGRQRLRSGTEGRPPPLAPLLRLLVLTVSQPRRRRLGRDDPRSPTPGAAVSARSTTHRRGRGGTRPGWGGGRAQRGGARGRPRAASPTARGTLSCRAAAGAELSGPVRPRGCANPALGYFCGAPDEESRAGSPPRVARESPGRKVRTLRAGTRPTPGPDPGLDPAPDPTPAAAHVPGRGGRSTGPARSGRGPGTRPARGALRPAPAHAHSPPPPALGRGGPRGS